MQVKPAVKIKIEFSYKEGKGDSEVAHQLLK